MRTQDISTEKVLANLSGTAFLTETGKVIEGNYAAGDYAPVIYDFSSNRYLPAWKKAPSVGEEPAKRTEDEGVSGMFVIRRLGTLATYIVANNKIYYRAVTPNDSFYVDLEDAVIDLRKALFFKIVEYKASAGAIVYEDELDQYVLVKYEVTNLTVESIVFEGCIYSKANFEFSRTILDLLLTLPGAYSFPYIDLVNYSIDTGYSNLWIRNLEYSGMVEQEQYVKLRNLEVWLSDPAGSGIDNIQCELFGLVVARYYYTALISWFQDPPGPSEIDSSFGVPWGFYNRGSGWQGPVDVFKPISPYYLGISSYAWRVRTICPWSDAYTILGTIENGVLTLGIMNGGYCVIYCDVAWEILEVAPIFHPTGLSISGWFIQYYSMRYSDGVGSTPPWSVQKWHYVVTTTDARRYVAYYNASYAYRNLQSSWRNLGSGLVGEESNYRAMLTKSFTPFGSLPASRNLYVINGVAYLEDGYSDSGGAIILEPKQIPEDELIGDTYLFGRCAKELQLTKKFRALYAMPGIYSQSFTVQYDYDLGCWVEEIKFWGRIAWIDEALEGRSRYRSQGGGDYGGANIPLQIADFGALPDELCKEITFRT